MTLNGAPGWGGGEEGGGQRLHYSHQFISSKEEKGGRENAFKVIDQMMRTPWAHRVLAK